MLAKDNPEAAAIWPVNEFGVILLPPALSRANCYPYRPGDSGYIANDFVHDGKYHNQFGTITSFSFIVPGYFRHYDLGTGVWTDEPLMACRLRLNSGEEIQFQGSLFETPCD
jgi:hypothetical protein